VPVQPIVLENESPYLAIDLHLIARHPDLVAAPKVDNGQDVWRAKTHYAGRAPLE
jgi:hypothetical protein